jgi:hypothetical protein
MKSKRFKISLIVAACLGLLFGIYAIRQSSDFGAFFSMQADSIEHAGTWEDDPKNWNRAFGEELPKEVKVIHSKYWRSDHFTVEFEYYFEVEATSRWRDMFLSKGKLQPVSPSTARSFRANHYSADIPSWFAPDPVDRYEVWDIAEYFGSVWIDKTTGHIFFYEWQI